MNELKPLHTDNQEDVPRRVWNQVEGKLNNDRQKRKLLRLRMITGVAACFIVASIFSYISLGFDHSNNQTFASNENYKSMAFEALEAPTSQLFDYNQVNDLKTTLVKMEPSFARRRK